MTTKQKKITLFIVLVMLLVSVFSQDAVLKAVDLINKNMILNEYEKAYSYALFILKYYGQDEIPYETLDLVKRTISTRAENLAKEEQYSILLEMEEDLQIAPDSVKNLAASSIQKAKDYFSKLEEEKKKQAEEEKRLMEELKKAENEKAIREAAKAEQAEQSQRIVSLFEETRKLDLEKERIREAERKATEQRQIELEKSKQEAESQYRTELTQMVETISKSNSDAITNVTKNNKSVMIGFGFLIAAIIAVVLIIVLFSFRQQKLQHEQFKSTLQTMQAMRAATPIYDSLSLPDKISNPMNNSLPGSAPLMLEDSGLTEGMSASLSGNNQEKLEIFNLIKVCQQYGSEIDKATGRKNVSRRVAELVYKISLQMGYTEQESTLHFAVGLVYDIGFLSIDTTILRSECLSKDQFEILKTHTTAGLNMVFFVPEDFRLLFKDAVSKHHENLDGSGYPHGLKDQDIPYIARALRVVESYIALISSRNYKEIRDRNAAIDELMHSENHYDQSIVQALDSIV